MIPDLLKLGPFTIHSFGLMMALAFLASGWLLAREMGRRGLRPEVAWDIVLGAAIGGVIGAKIYYLLEHWDAFTADPLGMTFSGAGLVWYGGLIGGLGAVFLVFRIRRLPAAEVLDALGSIVPLGHAIGRLGCFLNGDDYGRTTDLPWGIAFPAGSPPTFEQVHPTQIYEFLLYVGIFAYLWGRRKGAHPWPLLFWEYLVLGGAARFLVEFIRINPRVLLGLTMAQWISLGLVILGTAAALKLRGTAPTAGRG